MFWTSNVNPDFTPEIHFTLLIGRPKICPYYAIRVHLRRGVHRERGRHQNSSKQPGARNGGVYPGCVWSCVPEDAPAVRRQDGAVYPDPFGLRSKKIA